MKYDITNNDSIIELVPDTQEIEQGNTTSIELPLTVPSPQLIGQESVISIEKVITLPSILPSPELIEQEAERSFRSTVEIPNYIPPDGVVLLDVNEYGGDTSGIGTITKGDKYYKHSQDIATNVWHVKHNLNKRPAIHIEDINGNEMIAQIKHISNNYAIVLFGRDYLGSAHCN